MIFYPCYNIWKHTCTGGCQGATYCIFGRGFWDDEYTKRKITRWDMFKYIFFKDIPSRIAIKYYFWKNRKEIEEWVKEIVANMNKEKEDE